MTTPSEGELFKKILGPEWGKLHPDIQARFDKNPAPGKPLHYNGELSELACSSIGRMLGRNNSANRFNIRIDIRHALFGTTFTQAGVFRGVAV
jgi:hypothetical protein